MLKSRRLFLFLLIFVLSVWLVACGGAAPQTGGEEAEAPTEEAAAETTEEAASAEEESTEATTEAAEEAAAGPEAVEGCTDGLGCVTVAPGDPIQLASVLVTSGANATLGVDSQRGVEIAIDDRGELLGHSIELVPGDGSCSAEGGQTAATKVASDDSLVAVVGHSCSSSCTPATTIYNDAGMTMISPSCTAPALTGEESHEMSFLRTAHNDKVQGRVMAEFVYNELGLTTAATIHDGSPYADQLQQVFADVFVELGGEITAQEAINMGDTDMRPVLTSIATDEPEFLYYPIFIAEGALITTQAREVTGLEETILAGADGMISPDFISAAGEAAEGMYISGPDLAFSGGAYADFVAKHLEMYGEEPVSAFHAHAYDAAQMIFDAIEAVAQEDAEGNLLIGRQALRDALYATNDFDGITGNLNCGELGDCADPRIAVNHIEEGEYVPVFASGEAEAAAEGEEEMAEEEMAEEEAEAMEEEEVVEEDAALSDDDLLAAVLEEGVVVGSTDPNYAPQSFLTPEGDFEGFDVDVSTEIANRLGVEIEFVTPEWDAITAGNWGGQWDFSVGSMTITKPRAEALYFSEGYYFTPAQFAVRAGSDIESIEDIVGQAVCVGKATTYESYLNGEDVGIPSEHIRTPPPEDVTVFPLDTDAECAQSIQAGRDEFEIFLTSGTVVDEAIEKGIDIVKVGEPVYAETLAVAFDRNSPLDSTGLRDRVSEIILDMHADGTLSELSEKWFETDLTQQP